MKLGDITRESRETFKGDKTGIPIVGLEHLIPQELTFSAYDVDTDNTFTKMFHKGQILFGRRRAYLKKAAVAEFDGICSGDITVIEAIPGKVDKDLLPFIIQNDALFDYAVSRSAGGLSPRVKWEQLSDYEINLPPIEDQKVLADKLWAAYRLKEGYKKLLCATDKMVKSQFIEMFGEVEMKPFVDVCINKGEYGSNSPADDYDGNIRYVRITDITEEGNLNSLVVSPRKVEEKYMLLRDDLLFARTGNTVGKTYLHKSGRMIFAGYLIRYRLNKKLMLPQFAFAYTHTNQYYDWVEKIKKVGAQPNISAAQYDSMPIPVPSMAKQIEFVAIARQADKSKFELKQCIENIDKVIKSLING
jgi:type I restriction enzyme S subunit